MSHKWKFKLHIITNIYTDLEPQNSGRNHWHVNSYWTISKGKKRADEKNKK